MVTGLVVVLERDKESNMFMDAKNYSKQDKKSYETDTPLGATNQPSHRRWVCVWGGGRGSEVTGNRRENETGRETK